MPQEAESVEEWKGMKKFADWLIGHGLSCANDNGSLSYDDKIWEQRVGVILIHQAAEILMKAYLVKEGKIRPSKKIKFLDMFGKINFSEIDRDKFDRFNRIRNKIYHHSFQISWDKDTEIQSFLQEFKRLYGKAFHEQLKFNTLNTKKKFRKIHKKRFQKS